MGGLKRKDLSKGFLDESSAQAIELSPFLRSSVLQMLEAHLLLAPSNSKDDPELSLFSCMGCYRAEE